MLNGMGKDKADLYLKPYAPSLLDFVEAIYSDKAGQDDGGCCTASLPPRLRIAPG
jgi:hypothetical protein